MRHYLEATTGSSASAIELKRFVPGAFLLLCSVPCLLHAQQETFTLERRFTSTHGDPIAGAVITTAKWGEYAIGCQRSFLDDLAARHYSPDCSV